MRHWVPICPRLIPIQLARLGFRHRRSARLVEKWNNRRRRPVPSVACRPQPAAATSPRRGPTRWPAASGSSSRGAGADRRPAREHGRDRRRRGRRALDALPPLPDAPGARRRAGAAGGRGSPRPGPVRGQVATLPYQAPGQLGRDRPLALDVTRVLDEVPPHLVPDQLVAEARRAAAAWRSRCTWSTSTARTCCGWPAPRSSPSGSRTRPRSGRRSSRRACPTSTTGCKRSSRAASPSRCGCAGRVIALLLCVGTPVGSLEDIAKQGAAALELANDYTDFIEAARRRKPTTPAAEIQQNLFPPRIARIAGAPARGRAAADLRGRRRLVRLRREPRRRLAGDRRRRRHRADRGRARAPRRSARCAPPAAAARTSRAPLTAMHETVRRLGNPDFYVTALIARWRATRPRSPGSTAAHPPAYLVDVDGNLNVLDGPEHPPLGTGRTGSSLRALGAPAALRRAADPASPTG